MSDTGEIVQSGSVTPGHAVVWVTDGVVADAGPSTAGALTSEGITSSASNAFGIKSGPSTAPYVALYGGANPSGPPGFFVQNFGTATLATQFQLNMVGGNVLLGSGSALATNATYGFLQIPTCAGTPTGVPVNAAAGQAAVVLDTTNNRLCWNIGSGWNHIP